VVARQLAWRSTQRSGARRVRIAAFGVPARSNRDAGDSVLDDNEVLRLTTMHFEQSPPVRPLADANILIIWPKASASVGIVLRTFVSQHRRTSTGTFAFIGHPVPGSTLRESEFEVRAGSRSVRHRLLARERYIPFLSETIDGILSLPFLLATHCRYDLLITAGLNLGLLGLLLRQVGMIRRVAFVVMDYWPRKYTSSLWSGIYRRIYRWCSMHVDAVVDVAPTIEAARIQDGIRVPPNRRLTIPHVIDPAAVGWLPREQLEPDSLIWTGALTPEYGFDLVIEAMERLIVQRPAVTVHVTSYTQVPDHLRRRIRARGLERCFRFLGYIKGEAEFSRTVRRFRVGLAPYPPSAGTVKRFAGVARPWTYLANGVVPVLTGVPFDAEEIERAGAGFLIDYDPHQLATTVLKLLADDELHERCRQRGLELVRKRAPRPVFAGLLTRLGLVPDSDTPVEASRAAAATTP
jgi:glycosyltransferase involved in cell wall biosynthesis